MFELQQRLVEDKIRLFLKSNELHVPEQIQWTPIPFSGEWGISTPLFPIAAQTVRSSDQKRNVREFAQEIADNLANYLKLFPGFSRIESVRGYLNLYFPSSEYSQNVIDTVIESGIDYGKGYQKKLQVMVEFSQPNTHKAFHVGHLRSAILGESLCRILDAAGYTVVRANYIGDIGLHVIRWLWNYLKFHANEQPPREDITRWMGELYAEAIQRLDTHPEYEAEVRALYTLWDQRESDVVALWKQTRQWSLDGFDDIYQVLEIHFDRIYTISEAEKPGKEFVNALIDRGIAIDERPDGPVIVKIDDLLGLTKEKYRVFVVLRSDSTALYSTEDLALAEIKFTEYPELEKSLYVVDVRQSLHFQQVFKTLDIAGFPWANKCEHISYELVNLPGNVVVASREGTVVLLEDLIREATLRAREVVDEKNPDLSDEEKDMVAKMVGLGALKYPMLARENNRIVTFDWETALDFNGQAAPYIQYARVRANSILRRSDIDFPGSLTPIHTLEPTEIQLIDWIARFPDEIQRAAVEYKPLVIANIAYELARAFTDFYMQCPVLKAPPGVLEFRLRLVAAARQTISNALSLLGIHAPDIM